MAQMKPSVSKHILDKAAFIFLRHPGEAFTRMDIQNTLEVSKSTAARLLAELVDVLKLDVVMEGQIAYYILSENQQEHLYQTLDFILAVNDRERLAMNFLLHGYGESYIFNGTLKNLEEKFEHAGIISYRSASIRNVSRNVQKISEDNRFLIDTLLNSLETKTIVKIDYKGAFSDRVKTHELWPVGLYMRDDNLYLYAYSPRFENATSYAYSRIVSINYLYDEHYEIPDGINMDAVINDPFGVAIEPPRRVIVRVLNKQAFFEKEKEWPEGTAITELEDGSIRMEITISDPFAFRTWALSLGCNCIVESSDDIAEWIYWEHKQALKLYEGRFSESE